MMPLVSREDLVAIANSAGVVLPERYLAGIVPYPQELLDMADVYNPGTKMEQRVGPEDSSLYAYRHLIEHANLSDVEYKNEIFPDHGFFIIGDSGCGDYYAVRTDDSNAPVYIGGCHPGEYGDGDSEAQISNTIDDYIASLARG